MTQYKEPKLFGKDEDGFYLGKIEEISYEFFNRNKEFLYVCNRKTNLWIFSLFNGYRQLGIFEIERGENQFREGDLVIVEKKDGVIVNVVKE